MYYNDKHNNLVECRGDSYVYIGTYRFGEITIDGKKSRSDMIRIKCPYCNHEYDIRINCFKRGDKCNHCCNEYDKSFAYHIQVELGESLNKYWDWEKNSVNPYYISRRSDKKVWIKCSEKDYHGSYDVTCSHFYEGNRCPYCKLSSGKVHPKDSFAQYHIDNTDPNFLEKYWSDKNTLNPWKLAPRSTKKVWLICQEKDYHGDYEITCDNFYNSKKCSYCGNHKLHQLDSYGALYPYKAKYWDNERNKKSPYEVSPHNSRIKYWHICERCGKSFQRTLGSINRYECGVVCPSCNSSSGETRMMKWFNDKNYKLNIDYIHNEPYFKDLLSPKGNPLRPDFIFSELKLWFEYDGEFHYEKKYEGDSYEDMLINDKIKNEYAKKHDWKLIRIPYWDFDNIEKILSKYLNYNN